MAKPRLTDVLDTLGTAITNAVNAANILNDEGVQLPFQCGPGMVVAVKLAGVLGLGHGNSMIGLWPLPAENFERYSPDDTAQYDAQTVNLIATPSGDAFTFTGQSDTVYNVHTVINGIADVLVQTTANQSLPAIATAVAAAITAQNIPGISASASGPTVTLAGDLFEYFVNVGGTIGTLQTEVMRVRRPIEATIYSPDPITRTAIADAILSAVGTAIPSTHFLPMSDGQPLYVRFGARAGEKLVEKAQSSYSAFEDHIIFDTEYPITVTETVVQVGVVVDTTVVNNTAPVTAYIGG